MHENIWYIAAIWMGLAFLASLISIRIGISVALVEILVGVTAGNVHFGNGAHILQTTDWTNFLAMLGSGVLTFLAGADGDQTGQECQPHPNRRHIPNVLVHKKTPANVGSFVGVISAEMVRQFPCLGMANSIAADSEPAIGVRCKQIMWPFPKARFISVFRSRILAFPISRLGFRV